MNTVKLYRVTRLWTNLISVFILDGGIQHILYFVQVRLTVPTNDASYSLVWSQSKFGRWHQNIEARQSHDIHFLLNKD